MSIRQRLTLWYALMLMLMLLAFALVVYAGGIVVLRNASDRDLLVRARLLADDLGRDQDPTIVDMAYRVLTLDGQIIRTSGLPARRVPITPAAVAAAKKGGTHRETLTAQTQPGAPAGSASAVQQIRILTVPLGKPPRFILQVGEVAREERSFTGLLLLALAAVLVVGLPLAALGGWWLAGRALAPVRAMAATAQRIESSNLTERLTGSSQDELGRLASTFNELLDRLQAAFQRERRFIADVSHDLRTPLALIKSTIGVALNRPRSAEELRTVLGDIDGQVNRVSSLLDATLFLSRADADALKQNFAPVNLSELLTDLHETTAIYAREENDQSLACDVAPDLRVHGDSDQLTRLFLNLLDNAMQYTPRGGAIVLSAWAAGGRAQVSVSDNGLGIAPEDLIHIFDRFYRADTARANANGNHHGLGLSIAQAIARAHSGDITAQSALGRGTTFTVTIPLET